MEFSSDFCQLLPERAYFPKEFADKAKYIGLNLNELLDVS